MDNGDLEGSGEDEIHLQRGRKYRPVLDNDRAVLEMSSMDPGSSSSSSYHNKPASVKYVFSIMLILYITGLQYNICYYLRM